MLNLNMRSSRIGRICLDRPPSRCIVAAVPLVSESPPKPIAAPERSLVQRMEALQRANDIRSRRAQLKRDLKAGRQPIHELLLEPPEYLETAKVFDLLLAVPKYGRVKVNKILSQCRISPSKTIGGLSQRQRAELVALMRRR
jgi:S13-like protein